MATKEENMDVSDGEVESDEEGVDGDKKSENQSRKRIIENQYSLFAANQPLPSVPLMDLGLCGSYISFDDDLDQFQKDKEAGIFMKSDTNGEDADSSSTVAHSVCQSEPDSTTNGNHLGNAPYRGRGESGVGRPMKGTAIAQPKGGYKLFIKIGDDSGITKEALQGAFSAFGIVTDVYVPDNKPFAFVTFQTKEAAEQGGTALNGSDVNGSRIFCNWATPKEGGGGSVGGPRNCHKCSQPGHIARDCTGVAPVSDNAWGSSAPVQPVVANAWGGTSSSETASATTPGACGWGNDTATTNNVSAENSTVAPVVAGWGSTPSSVSAESVVAGWGAVTPSAGGSSAWGDQETTPPPRSESNAGRDGFSGRGRGRPMRGTPSVGPRGGYKLFVKLGEGHSITKDVLEGAFAAHGDVTDCYVPDGKPFAFVTYATQEDAEKGGNTLNGGEVNGTKIFCNWATPKEGGGGSSGTAATSSGSGWGSSVESAPPVTSAGWGNSTNSAESAPASNGWGSSPVPAATSGGWGDTPATVTSGGNSGWGSNTGNSGQNDSSSTPTRGGFSGRGRGRPMRGTPTLGPRGGYKLFVKLGEGHSITKDVLEGAFAAHGTVTDAYVPDGKPFAFVTYGTQEEAEKGGNALNGGDINGTKIFCNWATPKEGGGGGGGCHKCGQTGHMARECTGAQNSNSDNSGANAWGAPAASGSAGWEGTTSAGDVTVANDWGQTTPSATPATVTGWGATSSTVASTGGWGNPESASTALTASSGGWADTPSATTTAVSVEAPIVTPILDGCATTTTSTSTPGEKPVDPRPLNERLLALAMVPGLDINDSSQNSAGGGGWGSPAPAVSSNGWGASEPTPTVSSGGWGTSESTPTATVDTTASGWGSGIAAPSGGGGSTWGSESTPAPSETNSNRGGFSGRGRGRPMRGTPVANPRGGYKLFVKLGDKSGITKEHLEAAFSPFGTVTDAFAPDGKPFAFITFETQDMAEKGGTALNGTNLNGTRIYCDWAGPKPGGGAGGGGAPGTCFKCGQDGHMARECAGAGTTQNSTDSGVSGWGSTTSANSSGWGSISDLKPATTTTGSGWGETASAAPPVVTVGRWEGTSQAESKLPATTTSAGWGDSTPVPAAPPVTTGGGWGNATVAQTQPSVTESAGSTVSGWGVAASTIPVDMKPTVVVASSWGNSTDAVETKPASNGWDSTAVTAVTPGFWGNSTGSTKPAPASNGWGSSPVPAATSGGWGDTPATVTSGGDSGWGSNTENSGQNDSSSTPTRGGFSGRGRGKPMRGTPTLGPRGGYKLFVKLGEGHSITKDVLEGAFAAHGTVTDAYVPDGKPFAFVTYGTQEEAEKGGNALNGGDINGTKIFCNWATPKEGGGGGGAGGPRTCHKCGQAGHMARDCTGASNSTSDASGSSGWGSTETSSATSGSGWAATPTVPAGGGWGGSSTTNDSCATSSTPQSVTSGWGASSASTTAASADSVTIASGWGEASASTTTPPVAAAGGWGSTTTTDSAPAAAGGWGSADNKTSSVSETVSSGWGATSTSGGGNSGWGNSDDSTHNSASTPVRGGFSGRGRGRPMRGTPTLGPRGGYKLFVKLGEGHSLTKDVLEGAFAAHGAVTDCYVPDGKPFAFVTYSTEEDAEKGGNALNGSDVSGTKIFCNWAAPKEGGSGGPRTCNKCGQPGHMARECTGATSDSVPSAGASDAWGSGGDSVWGSTFTKTNDSDNAVPASAAVPALTVGGWGDSSSATSGWGSDSTQKSTVTTDFASTPGGWGSGGDGAKPADSWGGSTAGGWGLPESKSPAIDRPGEVYTKEQYDEKRRLDAVEEAKRAKEQEALDLEAKLAALKRETQMEQQRLYATQRKNREIPPPPRRKSEMMAGTPQYQDILAVAHLNTKPQLVSSVSGLPSVLRQSSYITRGDLKIKMERDASFITPATREPARPSSIIPLAPPTERSLNGQPTPKSIKKTEFRSKRATSPTDLFFPVKPATAPRGRKRKSADETVDPEYSSPSCVPVDLEPVVLPSRTRSGAQKMMKTIENQQSPSTSVSNITVAPRKPERGKTTPTAQPVKRSINDPPPCESPPRERPRTRLLDSIVSPKN